MFRIFCLIFLLFVSTKGFASSPSSTVLVSVSPHKYLVERIAGDTVKVILLVPAGSSAHTYEPTPKQMLAASHANIWFKIGEGFETRALKSLTSYNHRLKVVDLRQDVDMIVSDPHTGCCCHANSQDLHFWLSPKQLKVQASTILHALKEANPQYESFYEASAEKLNQELDALDGEIRELIEPVKNHLILVSHPAYAYFCRDYGLRQLSIEFEGKDPTPQQMNRILNQARMEKVSKVYIQAQYPSKGAHLFAKELNAKVISLDPYAENVQESLLVIARHFAER